MRIQHGTIITKPSEPKAPPGVLKYPEIYEAIADLPPGVWHSIECDSNDETHLIYKAIREWRKRRSFSLLVKLRIREKKVFWKRT